MYINENDKRMEILDCIEETYPRFKRLMDKLERGGITNQDIDIAFHMFEIRQLIVEYYADIYMSDKLGN